MAAVLTMVLLGGLGAGAPVDLDLRDDGPSSNRPLAPGESISWPIGVTAGPVDLSDLRVWVSGDASPDMAQALEVSLTGCRQAWVDGICPTEPFEIAEATSLQLWQQRQVRVLLPGGRIPASVEVLAEVGLSREVTDEIQGERATVRIGFSATGLDCRADCSAIVDPVLGPFDDLPTTGFPLLLSTAAGILAVLAGVGLARWGGARTLADRGGRRT